MQNFLLLLIKGFIIGFSIAIPVGPIGFLCIRRTLEGGFLLGFICGLGASVADMFLVLFTGVGFTIVNDLLLNYSTLFSLFGGLFLIYLGLKIFLSKPSTRMLKLTTQGLLGAFCSTFFLTLTNPLTLLCYMAALNGIGFVGYSNEPLVVLLVATGVLFGCIGWWTILCGFTALVREKMTGSWLVWLNRISGLMVLGFGVAILVKCLKK